MRPSRVRRNSQTHVSASAQFPRRRVTGDVTSVMSEGFLSAGPEEAELLVRTEVQQAEGKPIAAFSRFLRNFL